MAKSNERFFFDSVGGDWFLVPESKRKLWEKMTLNDPSTEEEIEAFDDEFSTCRISGGPSSYSFTDPRDD